MEWNADPCAFASFYDHMGAAYYLLLLLLHNDNQIHSQSKMSHPVKVSWNFQCERKEILPSKTMAAPSLHLQSDSCFGVYCLFLLPWHFHQSVHRTPNAILGYGYHHIRAHLFSLLFEVPLGHLFINVWIWNKKIEKG